MRIIVTYANTDDISQQGKNSFGSVGMAANGLRIDRTLMKMNWGLMELGQE
jgi:hypothetical protein